MRRLAVILVFAAMPSASQAQSHWGASVSFTPPWSADSQLQETLWGLEGGGLEGTEFTVGIVRGSTTGGDWGVSYFRRPVKDSVVSTTADSECSTTGGFTNCYAYSNTIAAHGVYVLGIEAHKFFSFGTIAQRVQLGLNIAGGIGFPRGTFEQTSTNESTLTGPPGFPPQTFSSTDTYTSPANETFYTYVPSAKVEAQAAIVVAPALKIKVSGGLNLPSAFAFRVGAVVLFGAR